MPDLFGPGSILLAQLEHWNLHSRGKSVPDSKLWADGDEQPSLDRNPLNRTRSGWLKESNKGTSLRSLHRRHMGVSIPALAFPRRQDGTIDVEAKPQPVTLFFGIIDFLQVLSRLPPHILCQWLCSSQSKQAEVLLAQRASICSSCLCRITTSGSAQSTC